MHGPRVTKAFSVKVTEARDHIADFYREVNGRMSEREWFPNAENISEHSELKNCVAFTWIQFNLRLFELTGDIRCIDYAEETAYNHIMQSICPDGKHLDLLHPPDWSEGFFLLEPASRLGALS